MNGGSNNDILTGGDGADKFIYSSGHDVIADFNAAEDPIELINGEVASASLNGADMVFKIGSGILTVKDGKDTDIVIGDKTYYNNFIYEEEKTLLTLGKNFNGTLQAENYSENVKNIDASNISKALNINGNAQNNVIVGTKKSDTLSGGSGDDTLTGGNGYDIFIYESGNDIITDYTAKKDTIKFTSEITNTSYSGNDLIFTTANGNLTVKDAAGKKITVTDSSGNTTTQIYSNINVNARTLSLFDSNNFLSDEPAIDDISENKFAVTDIQPTETNELETPKISYSGEK